MVPQFFSALRTAIPAAFWLACQSTSAVQAAEIIVFRSWAGNQLKEQDVIAELHLPAVLANRLPVIITQHGSTQDKPFKSGKGKTDVYSQQIIDKGLAQGFAVVAIDAFYPRNTQGTEKDQFPAAQFYALTLRNLLAADSRFDPERIFYTGFSYGGQMVIETLMPLAGPYRNSRWRAIASAEGNCQIQPKARAEAPPSIFVLGELSHYPPKPCIYLSEQLKQAGNVSQHVTISGANHYYSLSGVRDVVANSRTLNACTDNPVIRENHQLARHLDGTPTDLTKAFQTCSGNRSHTRGNEEKLGEATDHVIRFFTQYK
jgi:dienelactone hydrolase